MVIQDILSIKVNIINKIDSLFLRKYDMEYVCLFVCKISENILVKW